MFSQRSIWLEPQGTEREGEWMRERERQSERETVRECGCSCHSPEPCRPSSDKNNPVSLIKFTPVFRQTRNCPPEYERKTLNLNWPGPLTSQTLNSLGRLSVAWQYFVNMRHTTSHKQNLERPLLDEIQMRETCQPSHVSEHTAYSEMAQSSGKVLKKMF